MTTDDFALGTAFKKVKDEYSKQISNFTITCASHCGDHIKKKVDAVFPCSYYYLKQERPPWCERRGVRVFFVTVSSHPPASILRGPIILSNPVQWKRVDVGVWHPTKLYPGFFVSPSQSGQPTFGL